MKPIELSTQDIGRQAHQASERVVHETSPWIEGLGRFGHVAIGVVYATIGVLAAQTALSQGGGTTDSHGALAWIVQAPVRPRDPRRPRARLRRLRHLALHPGRSGHRVQGHHPDGRAQPPGLRIHWRDIWRPGPVGVRFGTGPCGKRRRQRRRRGAGLDGLALAQPFGQVLVATVGLGIIGVGLVQFYLAYSGKCCDSLQTSELSQAQERLVRAAGRIGFSARGIAFAIIGVLLLVAAVHARSDEVRGLGGALATLAQQPFGPWLLGIVASGLVVYGAFMMVKARYGRLVVR